MVSSKHINIVANLIVQSNQDVFDPLVMFDIILSKDLPDLIRMLFVAILFNHGHHLIRQYSVNYLGSKTDLHQLLDLLDLGMTTQINTHIVIDLLHKID